MEVASDGLPGLDMVVHDWHMIRAAGRRRRTHWVARATMLFGRREWLEAVGGLDLAYESVDAAIADMAFRAMSKGAIVEYWPELAALAGHVPSGLSARDTYVFLFRHYRRGWAGYVHFRRLMSTRRWMDERRAFTSARRSCLDASAADADLSRVAERDVTQPPAYPSVSAIVPTIGRYSYLPAALNSLREQTIRPAEVIVIDQNPAEERRPDVYQPFGDLNLTIIWQDEQGQSIARNAGLAAAAGPYVFLFDDDSIANPDLIERHLRSVVSHQFDISTGVSVPPSGDRGVLPNEWRIPRLAHTFDTGNCFLRLDAARDVGGLDRNFDRGPGADLDFGTRLYLAGHRILHNPGAVRVHFKAPIGGLRVHGSIKYNTDSGVLAPFPPVTQSYYGLRYLTRSQRGERAWLQFLTNRFPRQRRGGGRSAVLRAFIAMAAGLPLLPLKATRSSRQAERVFRRGVRLQEFPQTPRFG